VTDRHKYSSPGVTSPSKSSLLFAGRTANMASLRLHFVVAENAICAASRTHSAWPIKEALRGFLAGMRRKAGLPFAMGIRKYRFSW